VARAAEITPPDLVVMALLMERPRHGYDVNAELERRDVRDWAAISRPQVYYSLRKLAERGMIEPEPGGPGGGPERQVWRLRDAGRRALAAALDDDGWAAHRPPPPFLTWLALSPHAPPGAGARLVARRRAFLAAELERERATATSLAGEGAGVRAARLMVGLTTRQFEVELAWLDEVEALFAAPAPAPAAPAPASPPRETAVRRVRPAI
jgi:DNA-binding PadR family transcriptional regulator